MTTTNFTAVNNDCYKIARTLYKPTNCRVQITITYYSHVTYLHIPPSVNEVELV
uniref:Uncharacterized protein n=1 Tax=Anguilla anguilla TaxID=7936 RepID=A0A0E9U6M4_ANGAN